MKGYVGIRCAPIESKHTHTADLSPEEDEEGEGGEESRVVDVQQNLRPFLFNVALYTHTHTHTHNTLGKKPPTKGKWYTCLS